MYRVQIEVTTPQSERIHLEQESYSKAEACRLFSSTRRVVATVEVDTAARRSTPRARPQASGKSTERDMVCAVDGLPVEGRASGVVRRVQHDYSSALSGMATVGGL